MEIIKKIPVFTFYYVIPLTLGFGVGLIFRDNQTVNINKKLSMSLADYYTDIGEYVDEDVSKEFPEVERLLKKIEKRVKV